MRLTGYRQQRAAVDRLIGGAIDRIPKPSFQRLCDRDRLPPWNICTGDIQIVFFGLPICPFKREDKPVT